MTAVSTNASGATVRPIPRSTSLQQVAGREGPGQQRPQRLRPVNQLQDGRLALGRNDEAAAQHRQRIVAVGLDQPQERQHLRVADRGVRQHVGAPVLVDVAVAGVALRVELGGQVEGVVVALQVAVPAAVEVIHVPAQPHRPAAAQDVVEQALAAVGVEAGIAGLCGDGVGEVLGQRLRLRTFGGDGRPAGQAVTLAPRSGNSR